MRALADVVDRDDALAITEYLIKTLCRTNEGKVALVEFAKRHPRDVLRGARPEFVLKDGSPPRVALQRLLVRNDRELRKLAVEVGAQQLHHAGFEPPEDSNADVAEADSASDEPEITVEWLRVQRDEYGALVPFIAFMLAGDDDEPELYETACGFVLEELAAAPAAAISSAGDAAEVAEGGQLTALASQVAELEDQVELGHRAYRQLDEKFQAKAAAERTLSQTVGRLKSELSEAKAAAEVHEAETARLKGQLEELLRAQRRHDVVADGRMGQLQAENEKLQQQLISAKSEISARDTALAHANQMIEAIEEARSRLQDRLDAAVKERDQLVALSDLFQDAEPAAAAAQLQTVMGTLASIKAIVDRSVEAQRRLEEEAEAARLAELQEAALRAREVQRQRQLDETWAGREAERIEADLARWEAELTANGQPKHIVIDGHNLILRRFSPQMERTTREWLGEMVCEMNAELGLDIHLVFDGPVHMESSVQAICSGVKRYYASDADGGADARIASLIREFAPSDKTLVVSTDYRHVWSNAEEAREEGYDVDLLQAEPLHNYLIALDDARRAAATG